jgi:asparagine synthase (glutamine-hydrolysing)
MCAIAGLYAFAPSAPPADRAELRTIRDHMSARGPDGHGEWFSNDGRVALGHRRLAIIDLTEGGAQPMHSADGQLVITFNGEIYNYRELRRELEAEGHVFRSESDTEVLLHLYQAKGTAMLQDLRGMYAFALWDARKQALLLARDPFGIKPLYYTPTSTAPPPATAHCASPPRSRRCWLAATSTPRPSPPATPASSCGAACPRPSRCTAASARCRPGTSCG